MSRNVRVSSRQARSAREIARTSQTPATSAKAPAPRSRNEREALNDRIQRLECYIASADAQARHHNAAYADYVPPMDGWQRGGTTKRGQGRRPMHTQALARRRSVALMMQVAMLFVLIAAAVGWMNQRFHFWH